MKKLTLTGGALVLSIALAVAADKTLVSWILLDTTAQQGGSALTVQKGDQFDAIVFGERAPGKWMAGSDFYRRSGPAEAGAAETADPNTLIQMAIVYRGDQVAIYRDGALYAAHQAANVDLLGSPETQVVFGLRHWGAGSGHLRGSIADARIYDHALTPEQVQSLRPKTDSGPKPYAWWTFEKGKETDRLGRFPYNELAGGAKIAGGRLVLVDGAVLIATPARSRHQIVSGSETPAMPQNPPKDWPTFHLLHPGPGGAMPGDPNCAFYYKGEYHLHYIYNHRAGFAFSHVSSKDMVHWKWHPTTLEPRFTGHGMFSGTGFFARDGQPAIIYHGQGSGRNQLAFALDDKLEKWTKPVPIVPKDAEGHEPQFNNWDPDCWRMGDTYYALSGGGNPSLMKSTDLKNWLYLGPLLSDEFPTNLGIPKGEDISCANMFPIGNKWMLLCISHPLGCRYYLGDFKDEKFLPDFHAMMSWNGNNFFAPESVLAKDGRRVMWAWLLNVPVAPAGIQSLPRELELPGDGVLRIKPLRELQSLRTAARQEKNVRVKADTTRSLPDMGDAVELELSFRAPAAREFGVEVLCDAQGRNGLRIAVQPESKILRVGNVQAPFTLKPGEDLTLRVFIDKNLVEVFANDRQAALTARPYTPGTTGLNLFSQGADTALPQVRAWKMKSIYR